MFDRAHQFRGQIHVELDLAIGRHSRMLAS
jgi:hypothetical protein